MRALIVALGIAAAAYALTLPRDCTVEDAPAGCSANFDGRFEIFVTPIANSKVRRKVVSISTHGAVETWGSQY